MQRFTLIALLALVAAVSANYDHSKFQGVRLAGDELLEQKNIDIDYKILRVIDHTETILARNNYQITRLEVIDIKKKETSAIPDIISGGVTQSYVTLKFTSARGHGIHYIVKVYGKRNY